jgi:hypothetical protein
MSNGKGRFWGVEKDEKEGREKIWGKKEEKKI